MSQPRIMTAEGRLQTLVQKLQSLKRYEATQMSTKAGFTGTFRPAPDGPYCLAVDMHDAIEEVQRSDWDSKPYSGY